MINKIWLFLIIISLIYGILTFNMIPLNDAIMEAPQTAFRIFVEFIIFMTFWNGILRMTKDSGFLNVITKYIKKIIRPLFKELDKNDPALDYISANLCANLIGLGSAATPLGLKAMQELDKTNEDTNKPSKAMITLVTLNSTSFTLLPTSILAFRRSYNAQVNLSLIPWILLISFLTTAFALTLNFVFGRFYK